MFSKYQQLHMCNLTVWHVGNFFDVSFSFVSHSLSLLLQRRLPSLVALRWQHGAAACRSWKNRPLLRAASAFSQMRSKGSCYTPHFTLLHSTLYALHSSFHTLTLHFTLHTPHYALYTPHSTLYTSHSTLYTPHCARHTLRFTLYTLRSTLHTLHSTLYTLHSTLYTPYFTLQTLHSTLHT